VRSEKCQERSFGYACQSKCLPQSFDILGLPKSGFKVGDSESGINFQDLVINPASFRDVSRHSQSRHHSSPAARKLGLALHGTRGPRKTIFIPTGEEMGVCHTTLRQERTRIERTKTKRGRELFYREVDVSYIETSPTAPVARYYQIGIEYDSPRKKSDPVLWLFEYKRVLLSHHCKDQWIVSIELYCLFGESAGFRPLLRSVHYPPKRFSLAKNVRCKGVRKSIGGIQ
jgi:hypothetical protein